MILRTQKSKPFTLIDNVIQRRVWFFEFPIDAVTKFPHWDYRCHSSSFAFMRMNVCTSAGKNRFRMAYEWEQLNEHRIRCDECDNEKVLKLMWFNNAHRWNGEIFKWIYHSGRRRRAAMQIREWGFAWQVCAFIVLLLWPGVLAMCVWHRRASWNNI